MMKITEDRILDGLDYLCCQKEICIGAYDLINRLKSENERLNIRNKALTDITKNYDWKFAKAKFEAIKEFAERLKAISHPYADTQMVFELQIDNLLKEMAGE